MCDVYAERAPGPQFRDIWRNIKASYALLIDLETRPECMRLVDPRDRQAAASDAVQ